MKLTQPRFNHTFVKAMVVALFLFAGAFPAGVAYAYVLTVTKVSPGTVSGGTAPWSPEINCGVTCSFNYPDSPTQWIGLTATAPTPGGIFVGWSGACTGTNPNVCTIALTSAKTVTAIFDTITANAGVGREITLPTNSVVVSGASASDTDGSVASVLWTQTSGPSAATITNGNTLAPTFSNFVVGPYIFRLTATDNLGRTKSNEMCVVAKAANPSPDPGALWGMGNNNNGMLGLGYTSVCLLQLPTQSGVDTTWKSVTGGYANSAGIKTDGTLWVWGYNIYGELGIDYSFDHFSPIEPLPGTTWKSVSAMGQFTTTAIKSDGTLWTWGWNYDWALGRGDVADSSPNTVSYRTPTQVGSDTNWASIQNGDTYSMALKTDGTLWGWGNVDTTFSNCYGYVCYGSTPTPTQLFPGTIWKSFAAAPYPQGAGIKPDGTLWTWGGNAYGQLGVGDFIDRSSPTQVLPGTTWRSVTMGIETVAAIKSDGTLWTWGYNWSGVLGVGAPIVSPDYHDNTHSSPIQVLPGTTWSSVSAGNFSMMAIKSDGTLWGWGNNYSGQLGVGDTVARYFPTQVGTGTNWGSVMAADSSTLAVTAVPPTCTPPWGNTIASGISVQAFQVPSVISPTACPASETRTCNNGTLSGSYTNSNCVVLQPSATISANPTRVRSTSPGNTSTIFWILNNTSCTAKRNGVSWNPGPSFSSTNSYLDTITGQTVYTITCTGVTPKSVTVNVLAGFQEF